MVNAISNRTLDNYTYALRKAQKQQAPIIREALLQNRSAEDKALEDTILRNNLLNSITFLKSGDKELFTQALA